MIVYLLCLLAVIQSSRQCVPMSQPSGAEYRYQPPTQNIYQAPTLFKLVTSEKSTIVEEDESPEQSSVLLNLISETERIGCQADEIIYSPPNNDYHFVNDIIPPVIKCIENSGSFCRQAKLSCIRPDNSIYPMISGFARINDVDWATTELLRERADFLFTCNKNGQWTYLSDFPGLEGRIFITNQVFCHLVPNFNSPVEDYYSDYNEPTPFE